MNVCGLANTLPQVSDRVKAARTREHIQDDNIIITQEKTDETVVIPVNYYSHKVLEKYRSHIKPIPQLSEQYLNESIKDVCQLAGIESQVEVHAYSGAKRETSLVPKYTQITMHTARRTFVSLALSKGLDAETIRRWTGHKDLRSFAKYINIERERKKELMQKAFGAPEQPRVLKKVD
jgi:site-specific recombinase XerD